MNRPATKTVSPEVKTIVAQMISNAVARADLQRGLGSSFDGDRNYYTSLGYKQALTFTDYWNKYKREDIASRIVEAPCDDTWKDAPKVTLQEGDKDSFEKAWDDLVTKKKIFDYLKRVDILSGIGRYGVLFFGVKSTNSSNVAAEPVESAEELMYFSAYAEERAKINEVEVDPTNENFGLVKSYNLQQKINDKDISLMLHSSRALHVAEGLLEDEIFGVPRLERVMNRLEDIMKIVGGSAEMFWLGARPGYNFKLDSDITLTDDQKTEMKDQINEFMDGIRRALRLQGVDAQPLAQQVSDPQGHFDVQIDLISAASKIPKRILLGSERGELASMQDENNWNKLIDSRRETYAGPKILRPTVEKLQKLGILPEGKIEIHWPRAFQLSQKDIAEIAQKKFAALKNYTSSPEADLVLPVKYALKEIYGYSDSQIELIMSESEELRTDEDHQAMLDEEKAAAAEKLISKQQEQQGQRERTE